MKCAMLCMVLLVVLFAGRARAIDPGVASGTLTVGADLVKLRHSYVHLHDNAEKWLERPKEMRILLADRQVPEGILCGLNVFMTLSGAVRQGEIRGILLRLDPGKPNLVILTLLYPPKNPQQTLTNETLSHSGKSPIDKLQISDVRVSGALAHHNKGNADFGWPAVDCKIDFSAPVFHEPAVTASLSGKQALDSVQGKALVAKVRALAKGDLKAAQQHSTRRSNLQTEAMIAQLGPEARKLAKEMGAEMQEEVKRGHPRLFVRGSRAAIILGKKGTTLYTIVLEDGVWKVD